MCDIFHFKGLPFSNITRAVRLTLLLPFPDDQIFSPVKTKNYKNKINFEAYVLCNHIHCRLCFLYNQIASGTDKLKSNIIKKICRLNLVFKPTLDANCLMVNYLTLLICLARIWWSTWIAASASKASFFWWTSTVASASDLCNLRHKS